jgi:hypothetical protein
VWQDVENNTVDDAVEVKAACLSEAVESFVEDLETEDQPSPYAEGTDEVNVFVRLRDTNEEPFKYSVTASITYIASRV